MAISFFRLPGGGPSVTPARITQVLPSAKFPAVSAHQAPPLSDHEIHNPADPAGSGELLHGLKSRLGDKGKVQSRSEA